MGLKNVKERCRNIYIKQSMYNVYIHFRSGRDRCVRQRRFGSYGAVIDFIGSLDLAIDRIHIIYDTTHD